MPQRITAALTRRRFGGAVLVLAGIVIAAFVLWPSGDGSAPTKPLPIRIVSVPPLGLGFAYPKTWKRAVSGDVIRVTSPDGTLVLLFSSPVAQPAQAAVRAQTKAVLLKRFAPAKIVHDGPSALGAHDVSSFELTGERGENLVRALVHVTSTRWRTYVVTLLSGENPSRRSLTEARRILRTVNLSKPRNI
ncbi:MAG: hypothetical protein QOG42_22 [Solirubrobacteraceae bacterium]|jgi:uncharacterized protein YjeT (DUF2065 family)|nr:hypothetical protein [Solirubrobacteraceae bacterium]